MTIVEILCFSPFITCTVILVGMLQLGSIILSRAVNVTNILLISIVERCFFTHALRDQHGLLAQCDVVREKLQNLLKVMDSKEKKSGKEEKGDDDEGEGEGEEMSQGTDSMLSEDTRGEGDGGEDGEEGVVLRGSGASSGSRSFRRSVQMVEEETATLRAEVWAIWRVNKMKTICELYRL